MMGEQERGQPGQLDLGVPGESLKVQRPGGLQPEGHLTTKRLDIMSYWQAFEEDAAAP